MLDNLKKFLTKKLEDKCAKIVNDYNEKIEKEKKAQEIVVPVPTIKSSKKPSLAKEHDVFNTILKRDDILYRIKSENSKEVFRITCTGHNYVTRSITNLDFFSSYVAEEKQYHFICRVFVTNNNSYFYQYIRSDGTAAYLAVDRKKVQNVVKACESDDKCKMFYRPQNVNCVYSPKPGTYTKKTYNSEFVGYEGMETVDSYEIVNAELYSKIIEDL